MTLILNNAQIADLISMQDCVDILEDAFIELAEGRGAYVPSPQRHLLAEYAPERRHVCAQIDGRDRAETRRRGHPPQLRYPHILSRRTCRSPISGESGRKRSLCPLQQQCGELVRHVEHHVVPARKFLPPPTAFHCKVVEPPEGAVPAARQNVSDARHTIAGPT